MDKLVKPRAALTSLAQDWWSADEEDGSDETSPEPRNPPDTAPMVEPAEDSSFMDSEDSLQNQAQGSLSLVNQPQSVVQPPPSRRYPARDRRPPNRPGFVSYY